MKLDCKKQQQDLLTSIKRQSLESYQSFRPTDLFPYFKDLVIVLMVVKSLETSTSAHIRINFFEFPQRGVWVSLPHVLHELVVHTEHLYDCRWILRCRRCKPGGTFVKQTSF
jgi:hypothetical protein